MPVEPGLRPKVRGKFLYVGDRKLYVRGVTYGPFRPDAEGCEYHTPAVVEADFAQMAAHGINAVRTYTVPPRWLLDIAQKHHLRVMVGLPWEQHIAFLDDGRPRQIIHKVAEGVAACAGHPAVLCYTLGNEIPASMVRWYGQRRVERFLYRLYRAAKRADPEGLVTYVNYPTTEYLRLPFLDFLSFNVYLESRRTLGAYLARLQNLAGDRPLMMAEVGLDSLRNGEDKQAEVLQWQVRAAFAMGCAGLFVFAWTDEWHRGGFDIDDWAFGLVDRQRQPKAALSAVAEVYRDVPFPGQMRWPRISVVVCTYNGSRTIRETCERLAQLDYPNYEVVVVNDGSTDATARLLEPYERMGRFRVIHVANGGLSRARNLGAQAATGEIVAYCDDDAYPDPQWLKYLVFAFTHSRHVGIGGPNIPPEGDGLVAACVAHAPGGPNHVLLSDHEAEHIPGCNMAFRREALLNIGGFDPQFRIAGDDVDVCWRLQDCGGTIGFHPTAMVWHHRRNQVKGYLKQQRNYGVAEGMLEVKWPQKYNSFGHVTWMGRLYGSGVPMPPLLRRWVVYHGVWGSAPFQSLYMRQPGLLRSLPMMPEWYLVIAALAVLSLLGLLWWPLPAAVPLLLGAEGVPVGLAALAAADAPAYRGRWWERIAYRGLIFGLHQLQPVMRLHGRLHCGLTPWRRPRFQGAVLPRRRTHMIWDERWKAPEQRLAELAAALRREGHHPISGGPYDRWDLEVRGGPYGAVRLRLAIEKHGGGKQLIRIRSWPRTSKHVMSLFGLFVGVGVAAGFFSGVGATVVLVSLATMLLVRAWGDAGTATSHLLYALESVTPQQPSEAAEVEEASPDDAPPASPAEADGDPAPSERGSPVAATSSV